MDTNNEMDQVSHLGWSDAKAEPRADPPVVFARAEVAYSTSSRVIPVSSHGRRNRAMWVSQSNTGGSFAIRSFAGEVRGLQEPNSDITACRLQINHASAYMRDEDVIKRDAATCFLVGF
eukprot:1192684-Prorocentrum_minimum.AAC.3